METPSLFRLSNCSRLFELFQTRKTSMLTLTQVVLSLLQTYVNKLSSYFLKRRAAATTLDIRSVDRSQPSHVTPIWAMLPIWLPASFDCVGAFQNPTTRHRRALRLLQVEVWWSSPSTELVPCFFWTPRAARPCIRFKEWSRSASPPTRPPSSATLPAEVAWSSAIAGRRPFDSSTYSTTDPKVNWNIIDLH